MTACERLNRWKSRNRRSVVAVSEAPEGGWQAHLEYRGLQVNLNARSSEAICQAVIDALEEAGVPVA